MIRILALSFFLFQVGGDPIEREVYLMGTILKISSYAQDRQRGIREMEAAVRVIEQAETELSTWRPESELSRLNAQPAGIPFSLSPSTCLLMEKLDRWVRITHGAFDPSVGKLIHVWGIQGEMRIPDPAEIDAALAETGFVHLHLDREECTVTKGKAVVLDAGAFGKGEALDRVLLLAAKQGFDPMVLNFGGQVAVWKMPAVIEIANPLTRALPSGNFLRIPYGSISTSGQSEQQKTVQGKMIGHILNPETGMPAPDFGSVTVWNRSAFDADVLSTALYVMGPKRGLVWATGNRIKACFVEKLGRYECNYEIDFQFQNYSNSTSFPFFPFKQLGQ